MRLDLQAKLLRVLQEQEFERVGGTQPIQVDVRIIATTNRDLAVEAAAGTFRQDLYYRLSTIPIQIPPLRDRPEDIPLLAYRFAMQTGAETGKPINGLDAATIQLLQQYPWRGNVRELQHAVERAVILTTADVLQPSAFDAERFGLTDSLQAGPLGFAPSAPADAAFGSDWDGGGNGGHAVILRSLNISEAEALLIEKALEVTGNNRTRAAELLGMSVRTLRNKLNAPDKDAD
jgi:DNA-binding NtrC family response regulator